MTAATSSSVSRAAASSTSSDDRFISDQDSPSSSLQARRAGGMLLSVRLSHRIVKISASSRMALMRPYHPPIARTVLGSLTPVLTTTLSPIAQLLLFFVLPTFKHARTRLSYSEVSMVLILHPFTFLQKASSRLSPILLSA